MQILSVLQADAHNEFTTLIVTNLLRSIMLDVAFYADKTGDVLVKMLYNEKETTIPALKTISDPYYRWSDVKEYFKSLL